MAEWARASSRNNSLDDPDLYFAVGEDASLFVLSLRLQGRMTPPWGAGIQTNTLHPPAELPRVVK